MEQERVDILLSIYDPNIEYLKKQLISLNNQTYDNLKLYIFDDCVTNRCDVKIFKKYITNFPYEILEYEKNNLNYTCAFEKLVEKSTGKYIAFCDQDDIWMENKIEKCVNYLKEKNNLLVASDRKLIDGDDKIFCESVKNISTKNYDNWNIFDDITKYNIFVTYAVGMSILMDGDFARSTLPFSRYTGHDKWVLACASTEGTVGYIDEPLVMYRRHGKNVSGVLVGIDSRKDYFEKRIEPDLLMIKDFENKYPDHKDLDEIKTFANARKNGEILKLYKYRNLAPDIAKFDIVVSLLPDFLFSLLVKMAKYISKVLH